MKQIHFFAIVLLALFLHGCKTETTLVDLTSYRQAERDPGAQLLKDVRELSLEEAQKIALKNNPTYQEAYQAIAGARMRYYQALGAYSPVIQAATAVGQQLFHESGGSDYPVQSNSFYSFTTVQASWMLFDGLVRELRVIASQHEFKMQQNMEENACRLLLQGVAYAYSDILLAQSQLRIAEADLDFQNSMLREATLKFQSGTVQRSDVLNFQGKVNQARENIITAKYQQELGIYSLALLMGYVKGTLPDNIRFPEMRIEMEKTLVSLDAFLDMALANRPDLRAQRERLRIAENTVWQSWGAFSPMISAFANYSYSSDSSNNSGNNPMGFGNFYVAGSSFNYGAFATWTLFNGFIRYNKVREARIDLSRAQYSGAQYWLRVVHEVRSAYSNLTHSGEIVEVCRENLAVMREQRDLVAKEYLAGEIEVTRLNEAQFNLIRSEMALAESRIKCYKAKEQLEAAANINALGLRRKYAELSIWSDKN